MKLSICIPTYNRVNYLKRNIKIILLQINEIELNNDVEICISDNCSLDDTEHVIKLLKEEYPHNIIRYRKNDRNLGPDWNYIHAMRMAHGEYSILWGDDDFFKEHALSFILKLLADNPSVSLFLSNRSCIDASGKPLYEQIFMRDDIETLLIDFSKTDSARIYFSLSRDIACLLSFISSVIYKTHIINEFEFDESYIGSQYAFLFYWWSHLKVGNKLLYIKESYINCTINVPQSFGVGVERVIVDYRGYLFVANKIFASDPLRIDFLNVVNKSHQFNELCDLIISDRELFLAKLYPLLIECYNDRIQLDRMVKQNSGKGLFFNFLKLSLPTWLVLIIQRMR